MGCITLSDKDLLQVRQKKNIGTNTNNQQNISSSPPNKGYRQLSLPVATNTNDSTIVQSDIKIKLSTLQQIRLSSSHKRILLNNQRQIPVVNAKIKDQSPYAITDANSKPILPFYLRPIGQLLDESP